MNAPIASSLFLRTLPGSLAWPNTTSNMDRSPQNWLHDSNHLWVACPGNPQYRGGSDERRDALSTICQLKTAGWPPVRAHRNRAENGCHPGSAWFAENDRLSRW